MIPTKPSTGCPTGTEKGGKDNEDCCCKGIENCCWTKCSVDGTEENLQNLKNCAISKSMGVPQWSYAKLQANGNERAFVAQGGKVA